MFDNSGTPEEGYTLARFCTPKSLRYDIRDDPSAHRTVAGYAAKWLSVVAPR